MKKGRWKTGLGLALCVIMLVTCFFPASATALEGVTSNQQETQQSQQGGSQNDQKKQDAQSGNSQDQSNNNAVSKPKVRQQSKGQLAPAKTKAALDSIIAKDKQEKALCYTTLYDGEDRIVDTNDPKKKQDSYYKPKSEGGEGGTVDLGSSLRVYFRMAEIQEHDGEKGVQENTVYYMDLPQELIPMEKDKDGNKLVDPDDPVTFFQEGDMECVGGIYSSENGYELQMQFENVEDQLEISGGFQYGVTVSKELKQGERYTVDYVPGGSLQFTVTPKEEEPVKPSECLILEAPEDKQDAEDKINWTLTLTDDHLKMDAKRLKVKFAEGSAILVQRNASDPKDLFKMSSIKITYKDGTTKTLIPTRLSGTSISYCQEGAALDPTMTYNKDQNRGIICSAYVDDGDYKNEQTVVERSRSDTYFLVNTLYIDLGGLKSNGSSCGNIHGSDNPAALDAGIEKYEFNFTSQIYDNYNLVGKDYEAKAYLMEPEENGKKLAKACEKSLRDFDRPQSSSVTENVSGGATCYEGMPASVQTEFHADNSKYSGNYYWMEFTPQHQYDPKRNAYDYRNDTGTNYYTNNYSFYELQGKSLTGDSATFKTFRIGSESKWTWRGALSYDEFSDLNRPNWTQVIEDSDVVVRYQMEQVFQGMDPSKKLIFYRSANKVNGRYIYLVIDPDTRETAKKSAESNHWSRMIEMTRASGGGTDSAKPARWKVHVFNAPNQKVDLEFNQSLGSVQTGDQDRGKESTQGITDSMVSSNTVYGTEPEPKSNPATVSCGTYRFDQNKAAVMTGRWVNQNTIFWEFTCNTENWNKGWGTSDFYIKVPQGQTLLLGETNSSGNPEQIVDGQSISSKYLYYQDSGNSWSVMGVDYKTAGYKTREGLTTGASIEKNTRGTTMTANSGEQIYFAGPTAPSDSAPYSYSTDGSIPQYDGKHVKIGFFTRVDSGDINTASSCQAELVGNTGDVTQWGNGKGSALLSSFKVKATGKMPWMPVTKSLSDTKMETDEDTDVSGIKDTWKLTALTNGTNQSYVKNNLIDGTYTGLYSGTWAVHDDMSRSAAKVQAGNESSISPADYTKLTSMKITVNGNGTSGILDVKASDLKAAEEAENHTTTLTSGKLTLTLKYQGSMKDGFDLRLNGLKDVEKIEVTYDTSFDQKGFCEAAAASGDGENIIHQVKMINGASSESWDGGVQPPESVTITRDIAASLAMNKAVTSAPKQDIEHGGYEASYKLDTQVGYKATDYVSIEDFLLGYTDSDYGGSNKVSYDENDKDALKALAQTLDVKNMKIMVSGPGFDKEEEIYSGGVRDGQWSGRAESGWVVNFVYKPREEFTDHPGSLYQVKVSRADGTKVPADTKISIMYDMRIVMDGKDGFRDSEWYQGGTLIISNGGEAMIPYSAGTSGQQIQNTEENVLKVDCGAGVEAKFLVNGIVGKEQATEIGNNSRASWTIYDWTGTSGKKDISSTMQDSGFYEISEFTYKDPATGETIKLSDMTDTAKKEQLTNHLRYVLEKHTKFDNIKVYYTDTKPTGKNAQLSEKDLLHASGLSFKGTNPQQDENLTVKDAEGKEHNLSITTKTTAGNLTSFGFDITVDKLSQERYLAVTYDTETDWDAFFEEISGEYADCTIATSFHNVLGNKENSMKEENGNHVDIQEEGLQKSLAGSVPKEGKASWRLKADTGFSNNKSILLKDAVSVSTEDTRIKKAAEAALAIDPDSIVVKQNGKVIYSGGRLQADGWKDDNLIIHTDGRTLDVTIQNTEDNKVLDAGQDYIVDYDTVLDQDAYIAHGGKAGDSAKLQNSALMERGGSTFQASAGSDFEPEIPVQAEKTYKGNGADGKDTSTTQWSVTGKTGNAGRKEFTLQDKVTSDPAEEAVQKALVLSDFDIAVKTGKEATVHYTADHLPDGAAFTSDGDSFKLTFKSLPKNTMVTVTYTVRIDRDRYLAAGGQEGKVLSLKNAFHVAAADGAVADDSKSGTIEVDKPLKKSGKVLSKKAANGNPIVTWDFDVNLYSMYTEQELEKLNDATVSDVLNPVLLVDLGSIKLTDPDGNEIPGDAYTVAQKRSTLAVQILEPVKYPKFHLQFETECGASVDGLVNNAELRVDGTKTASSKTEDLGEISAVTQHGHIKSMKVPEYTPVAWKYLDHELCTKAGLFEFGITQVDENGKKIEGGYTDTAKNDGNGKITFQKITYREKPVEGSYYYQIRETSLVKPYTYTLDRRVFTIRVDVQKDGSQYLVSSVITDPQQYDEVRFDNATVTNRDFTVTKKWSDSSDRAGLRPQAIRVYLLNHGERYENMAVTLNEENNWTYTWKDLPMAGADYSVEEVPVLGYNAEVKDGDWQSTITNKVETGGLLIAKQVKGTEDPKKKYHFTLTLQKEEYGTGEPVDLSGTFGDVTFHDGVAEFDLKAGSYVRVKDLPAGVCYTVKEDDYTKEGFNSPEYLNQSGTIQKDDSVLVTVTNVKAGAVKTGDDSRTEQWIILSMLALMGAVAPVMDLRRRRRS